MSVCLFNQGNFVRIIEGASFQDNAVKMIPYKNHILGVNTQYPENWTKHEGNDNVRFISPQQNASDNHTEQLKIASFAPGSISFFQSKKTSLPILANNTISYLNQTKKDFDLLNSHPGTANGKKAHILEYVYTSPLGATKSLGILIPNGGNIYFISYFADPTKYSKLLPVISNMINSTEVGIFDSGTSSSSSSSSENSNDGSSGSKHHDDTNSNDGSSGSKHHDDTNSNDGSSGSKHHDDKHNNGGKKKCPNGTDPSGDCIEQEVNPSE